MKKIAAVLLVLPVLAHAEMPDYDVKSYCARISSMGGASSQMVKQGCFENEQAAYNHVKPVWDSLSTETRNYCQRIAHYTGSYAALEGCVDMEQSAQQSNGDFTFKR
jgi:hypothetical protein